MTHDPRDQEIASLKQVIQQLEQTSKMLVRRDLDLRRAYEELKLVDQQKSEFVSVAAHQLRTPLTSVRFAIQILREVTTGKLEPAQQDMLMKAEESMKRMFTLIQDLLMIDKLEYGNLQFEKSPFDLTELIKEIYDHEVARATGRNIKLTLESNTEIPHYSGDRRRLQDVFSNLIDNAIKYSHEGGKVLCRITHNEGAVTITVSDEGIGIPENEVSALFRKFSRLPNAMRVDPGGSGLGLYICRSIVERHGGTISFVPNVPQGTCFTVVLPL